MANTVQIKLLENKTAQALWNGRPIEYEGGYRIIAGEVDATEFQLTSVPKQYEKATFTIIGYNAGKKAVEIIDVTLNSVIKLPVGMAKAGYSSLVFWCKSNGETVYWAPIKLKIYNTDPDWASHSVDISDSKFNILQGQIDDLDGKVSDLQSEVDGINLSAYVKKTDVRQTVEVDGTDPVSGKAVNDAIEIGINEAQTNAVEQAQQYTDTEIHNLDTDVDDKLAALLAQKGEADGFASLGADGKVPKDQLPDTSVPDATTTVKGIATLGSAGGAATYESVDELVKSKGQADGLATLGADGKIPDDQLPDDIGYTLPVATDTRLGGVMGYNPSEVASDAVESRVMVNPLGQMAAFVPIANHTTIGCVKSSPSGRTGTRCDVEINDDGTMMVYVPNSGGGGGSAILQKTIDNSSSNVSEVKADRGSTVTVTDADVTATCHVDIYPTDTATEQFLLTALSTNIVAVSNGSFTLPLLQPLPAEWAMYYTITEVI